MNIHQMQASESMHGKGNVYHHWEVLKGMVS